MPLSIPSHKRLFAGAAALASIAALAALASSAADAARAAGPPRCTTAGLVLWVPDGTGNGAAGSIFYNLNFTNQSGHRCTLRGFPGVSAVNLAGHQLGRAAQRDTTRSAHLVSLANDATATMVLRTADTGVFSPAVCRPVQAAGLRVYPPGQTVAKYVSLPFSACSRSGPSYLTVRPVTR
ncbi:MAG: DUF4232 domain-containing protein [Solirubrobacteraceae bacterium]